LYRRFPRATPKIQQIIDAFGSHIDTDLQQRGVEFSSLFRRYDNMRSALLEPMPPFEKDPSSTSQSSSSMQDLNHVSTNGVTAGEDLLGNFGSPTKTDVGSSLLDIIGSTGLSIRRNPT
jgi:AP-1 complex subunit gamma-1